MALVRTRPTPRGLNRLLGNYGPNASVSGFQRAHIIGVGFVDDEDSELAWFKKLLGPNGADERYNSVLLPEADRGAAILGWKLRDAEAE